MHTALKSYATVQVLSLDGHGRTQRLHVKRRDLLRGIKLQPRDLRRIEPSLGSINKSTYTITVKEDALLIHLQGVRYPFLKADTLEDGFLALLYSQDALSVSPAGSPTYPSSKGGYADLHTSNGTSSSQHKCSGICNNTSKLVQLLTTHDL